MNDWKPWPVLIVAVAALMLGGAGLLRPQNVQLVTSPDAEHTLTVTGEGKIETKPDEAAITVGVTAKGETAQDAQAEANGMAAAVIAAIKDAGIAADKLRTVNIRLHPQYVYESGQAPQLIGYEASMDIEVRSDDVDNIGQVIDAAVGAGANELRSIRFRVRNEEQLKQQAIDAAVADARKKADATAAKLGTEVIGIKTVTIGEAGSPGDEIGFRTGVQVKMVAADAAPVLPGTQDYLVNVAVTFIVK